MNREVENVRPDILCLQVILIPWIILKSFKEVDNNDHIIRKGLEHQGFKVILNDFWINFHKVLYKKRTRNRIDGEAICYLESKYDLLEFKYVDFFISEEHNLFNRDNVALFAILRDKKQPNVVLIVITTHLLFNKKRGDIKMSQVHLITNIGACFQEKYSTLIFCMDSNL